MDSELIAVAARHLERYSFGAGQGQISGLVEGETLRFEWQTATERGHGALRSTRDGARVEGTWAIEAGKRGGQPCIRGLRITVADVLDYMASGMSSDEILRDFPDLAPEDLQACLAFAADRERRLVSIPPA